jgi:hypothetical protein
MRRSKKEPVGWIGPVKGKGSGTSLGKGRWRVIDSTGQWIAAGFTTRAYALRWIDSFHLTWAGHRLNNHDRKWLLLHWYPARPVRLDPKTRASTESSDANVLNTEETKAQAAAGDSRKPKVRATLRPCDPRPQKRRETPGTVKMAAHQANGMTTRS